MADRYRVITLPRASEDLQELFGYIEQQSPQNAAGVAAGSLPRSTHWYNSPTGTMCTRTAGTRRGWWPLDPVPPVIIYYRTDEQRRSVRILSIRHAGPRAAKAFK